MHAKGRPALTETSPTADDHGLEQVEITLRSPLEGWISGLDEVPDAVFADRLLGDGVAIDPVGSTLYAPCDAVVRGVQPTGHAVTLALGNGAELLMHIGIDTVAMGGKGFTPCVKEGQTVSTGDPLIRFDPDAIICNATAAITPILLLTHDTLRAVRCHEDGMVKAGAPILRLIAVAPEAGSEAEAPVSEGDEVTRKVRVPLAHGIHARPAARLRAAASDYRAELWLAKGRKRAKLASPVGLMTLGVVHGDKISVIGRGEDAKAAVDALAALIESGMGEGSDTPSAKPAAKPVAAPSAPVISSAPPADGIYRGVTAAAGLVVGTVRRLRVEEADIAETGEGAAVEEPRLDAALATLTERIEADLSHAAGPGRAILEAHGAILADPELRDMARAAIDGGASAEAAWRAALRPQAEALQATGDAHLAERADDMRDLERRVIALLTGREDAAMTLPPDTILIADDLLPSQVMGIDPDKVRGFCVAQGGPTSHVAILAASMGLPALVAMGPAISHVEDGAVAILDATAGTLTVDPAEEVLSAARARVADRAAALAAARESAGKPCHMADGERVEVFANLASAADAARAVESGAEGSGLLRTEFLFLDRESAPDIGEQQREYQAIADALQGRPLIIRLLDIGGDKPAPYLPIAAEENPALGLRGIRVGFANPQVLDDQLRAILKVAPLGQAKIMVPMVAGVDELRRVRTALDRVKDELGIAEKVELGIMVETPAAAIGADLLAAEADFLSIGTNDLTQYTLAMDRGNPAVAGSIDGLHPAVLRLIAETCRGASRHGRWTGVCGGLASDPLAVPILIGLGVRELSATVAMVPEVKALVSRLTLDSVQVLAEKALACATAEDVRTLAREFAV
ncbi:phosphoenolpyruvate--protein phosphotransferase [Stakelama pacifica]|uniref:phosphoenolpyruvate--protein phosphotransferase n=1 Tax=Stakelama pacifica TaxID=517720 RepID=A0A4R6FG53_9SPHN|nr:phosphoenolpyruvate--protein phosphotransferase [Stakelama pacifica]TDN80311.1 phosphocarrier protein HPr /phosphoenolpyruvate--protein phosphotransferase /PTS system IIA component (Glc family) [Stakelama pacifica]GGO97948.1 phosphoenolpyruvate--protein phosphotransferase [Stakelama pacifica]